MLEMKLSTPSDWPACKSLWQKAFGDDDAYIENYYVNQYRPDRLLTLKDEAGLRTMLILFPLEQRWPDGGLTKSAYLYALATDPSARGQGYATFLMRYADYCLQERATPFLTTVPASPDRVPLFTAADFQPCHPLDEATLPTPAPGNTPATAVTPTEYRTLRESHLTAIAHAVYDASYLTFQQQVSALSAGGLYKIETPSGPACAVAERTEDLLDVKELLAPAGTQQTALSALAAALPGSTHSRVRCPAGRGELPGAARRPFGMGKRIPPTPKPLGESYFPLAFD